jgi:hypothetical protein
LKKESGPKNSSWRLHDDEKENALLKGAEVFANETTKIKSSILFRITSAPQNFN